MDRILEEAIGLTRSEGKVSCMHLQRKLNIGYGQAQRLIKEMQNLGIIGEYRGNGLPYLVITA